MRSAVRTVRIPDGHLNGFRSDNIVSIEIAASATRLVMIRTFFSYNKFNTVLTKSHDDMERTALQKG
jgi:hypothetical protein